MSDDLVLVRWRWDSWYGEISGLFVCSAAEFDALPGHGTVSLGEVLGKHSEVEAPLIGNTLTVVSRDQGLVAQLVAAAGDMTICGYNPVQRLRDDERWAGPEVVAAPEHNPNAGLAREYDTDEDGLADALSALLMAAGLTDECENQTEEWRDERDGETVMLYLDGGDAFQPGLVFARWSGEERPDNATLRVHLPPWKTNWALTSMSATEQRAYLDTVWHVAAAWRSLADELHAPSVQAEPKSDFDEDDGE